MNHPLQRREFLGAMGTLAATTALPLSLRNRASAAQAIRNVSDNATRNGALAIEPFDYQGVRLGSRTACISILICATRSGR
jgi:hypothetical protein